MSRAILHGRTVKPLVLKEDKRGVPSVSFSLLDQNGKDYHPCFADGNIARTICRKVKEGEPMIMICDIVSTPDSLSMGISSRVAFRVMTFFHG